MFFINVPLALVVLLISFLHVPESRDDDGNTRLDWSGAALATAGLGALVYGLIESSSLGLGHPLVIATLIGGAFLLAVFFVVEARSAHPMMPLDAVSLAQLHRRQPADAVSLHRVGRRHVFLAAESDSSPALFGDGGGRGLLPFILIMFVLSRWSGGLVKRYGAKVPLVGARPSSHSASLLFMVPAVGGNYWTTFFRRSWCSDWAWR